MYIVYITYFFGLNFAFYSVVSQNALWNGKQCRWSEAIRSRSALLAYVILSDTLVYGIWEHLPYMYIIFFFFFFFFLQSKELTFFLLLIHFRMNFCNIHLYLHILVEKWTYIYLELSSMLMGTQNLRSLMFLQYLLQNFNACINCIDYLVMGIKPQRQNDKQCKVWSLLFKCSCVCS